MLRSSICRLNISNRICSQFNYNVSDCVFAVQSVRFRVRRPLEMGTSKSKLYRIPEHKPQDEDERKELLRLQAIYRTKMKSLRAFFVEEKRKRDEALAKKPQSVEDDADFKRISKINDEWNAEVAKVREARLAKERIETERQIKLFLEQQQELEEEQRRITNELVLREKEAAKSFVVRENFDEALEKALANKTDFNFAIDATGNRYAGRTGKEIVETLKKDESVES